MGDGFWDDTLSDWVSDRAASVPNNSARFPECDRKGDEMAAGREPGKAAGRGGSMCGWGKQCDRVSDLKYRLL